jgi:hypothetical protein
LDSPCAAFRHATFALESKLTQSRGPRLPPRLSMEQMIAAFGSTYRAIDIRTATLKQKGAWINAYTVNRLTDRLKIVGLRRGHWSRSKMFESK